MSANPIMVITKTKDVNLAALRAMLGEKCGQFLVTVHNYRITSIAAVEREKSIDEISATQPMQAVARSPEDVT